MGGFDFAFGHLVFFEKFVGLWCGIFEVDEFGDVVLAVADDIGRNAVTDGNGLVADGEKRYSLPEMKSSTMIECPCLKASSTACW